MVRPLAAKLSAFLLAIALAVGSADPARAQATVDLQLVLAVDVSGSVSDERFRLQKEGYAQAFRNWRILEAIRSGTSRAIAVTTCGPSVSVRLSSATENGGAVSSAPTLAPSTRNRTPAVPDWASNASATSGVVPDTTAPAAGTVTETAGGVVSPVSAQIEAASAFNTVGLSTGLTPRLSGGGLVMLVGLMYVGRVGVLTLAVVLSRRREQRATALTYAREDVAVG